ncbi:hypothetical protein FKW77_004789 [Venturia effusa]|uniref:WLM domain-containing protein n=1 Tax=Venturia effusa TaxID=50376 RepID=A0A517LMU3_9PEZI|nr:hypothetical protein FKW77_004789 [Venturia effusa]
MASADIEDSRAFDARNDQPQEAMSNLHLTTDHDSSEDNVNITIQHHGKPLAISLPAQATLTGLSNHVAEVLSIPLSNQKFMITPKIGTLKPPFTIDHALSSLTNKKIVLLGSAVEDISKLSQSIASASAPRRPGPIKAAQPARNRDWKKVQDESIYTFHTIRPLLYLPNSDRSQRFLERLAQDPGIKSSMRKHKFSVGLLTEMDPAMHTTHESRTLGLNRNRGEVIELRLRTDAYDGYRDYKTIRKTLCHELSHNVWGDHDRNFWDLTKAIEKEVEAGDWTRGGRSVGEEEFYNPNDGGVSDEHFDHGGWTGGEYVLGGGNGGQSGLSRREIAAQAAEERMRKAKEADQSEGS